MVDGGDTKRISEISFQENGIRVKKGNHGTDFADSQQGEEHIEDWLKVGDIAEAASVLKHIVIDEIIYHSVISNTLSQNEKTKMTR